MAESQIGVVTHFYDHISVAVVKVTDGTLKVGDKVHIKGHATDFEQTVDSMQIGHEKIEKAKAGQEIGMKVSEPVRAHDKVYK